MNLDVVKTLPCYADRDLTVFEDAVGFNYILTVTTLNDEHYNSNPGETTCNELPQCHAAERNGNTLLNSSTKNRTLCRTK